MEIIQNIEFKLSQNIFSKSMHLKGSTKMDSSLSIEEQRLCSTCKYELTKFKCSSIGKIKFPDSPYCSWWRDKKVKLNNMRDYRSLK